MAAPYGDILNKDSVDHRMVCIKAGILPANFYAIAFCEWLVANYANPITPDTIWYSAKELDKSKFGSGVSFTGNISYDKTVLKELKKEWLAYRAGLKADQEKEAAEKLAQKQKEKEEKKKAKQSSAGEDKLKTLEKEHKKCKNDIKDIEKQIANGKKKQMDVSAAKKKYEELLQQENDLRKQIEDLKKAEDAEKQKEQQEKELVKKKANDVKWWYEKLVQYKKKEIGNVIYQESKGYGTDKLLMFAEKTAESFQEMNIYRSTENLSEETINSLCKEAWAMFDVRTGIENDMDPNVLAMSDDIRPDAAAACLSGKISNTFALAQQAVNLLSPDAIKKQAMFLLTATTVAISRVTQNVVGALQRQLSAILDFSCILAIPTDAANRLVSAIMTPDQVMVEINKAMNDDELKNKQTEEQEKQMKEVQEQITGKVQELQYYYDTNIGSVTKEIENIVGVINQGPDWYLQNINKIARKYETTAINYIYDKGSWLLDKKYQYVDGSVETLLSLLVSPINDALIKVQLIVIREVVKVLKLVEAIAMSLIQKAIMLLLGMFGA